jgi:hypothetical protein
VAAVEFQRQKKVAADGWSERSTLARAAPRRMSAVTIRHHLPRAAGRAPAVAAPRLLARVAGVYYLVIFIVAPSGAATATPLKMLLTMACDVAVAVIFYTLLKRSYSGSSSSR